MRPVVTLSLVWMALSAVACNGDDTETTPGETNDPDPDPDAVTYTRDVQPILREHCARCHDGAGVGPGNFDDYASASALADTMVVRIDAGEMPPAAADPDCRPYQGQEGYNLDAASRDVIAAWAAAGAPEGDPNDATPNPFVAPELSRRDMELRIRAPYNPQFDESNEYRCFLLDADTSSDFFISGFESIIDHAEISHHTVFFVDPDGGSEALVTDPATQSWKCPDVQPDPDWLNLHAWAPGATPIEFPEGKGLRVPKGSQLIVQMHYFEPSPDVDGTLDQPGYYLKTEASVDEEIYYAPIGPEGFTIPAGEAEHSESVYFQLAYLYGAPLTTTVYGVMPHMHVLGKGYDFWADAEDGTETCLLRSDDYDFSNQPTYFFDEPVVLPPTSSLGITCTWDNSADNLAQLNSPPIDVAWGENTQQEMCYALMYIGISN